MMMTKDSDLPEDPDDDPRCWFVWIMYNFQEMYDYELDNDGTRRWSRSRRVMIYWKTMKKDIGFENNAEDVEADNGWVLWRFRKEVLKNMTMIWKIQDFFYLTIM